MKDKPKPQPEKQQATVVLADDAPLFRRKLKDTFERSGSIRLIGEATNGIEALDMTLRLHPDVVIMDLEMPKMDGLSALQQLMSFQPTPTIMLSELSDENSLRCFDALKKGAVDFLKKNNVFAPDSRTKEGGDLNLRILHAAGMEVTCTEKLFFTPEAVPQTPPRLGDIIFCEECGARNIFDMEQKKLLKELHCHHCGDLLEENIITRYKRLQGITLIGAGRGSISNLLRIIQALPDETAEAFIIAADISASAADRLAKYLEAISSIAVQRVRNDMDIEGGNCYIASRVDLLSLKPYSTSYTINLSPPSPEKNCIDTAMLSMSSVFKAKTTGFLLSGSGQAGRLGLSTIKKHGGRTIILHQSNCLFSEMINNARSCCIIDHVVKEQEAAALIARPQNTSNSKRAAA